jgi:hypothetical protein
MTDQTVNIPKETEDPAPVLQVVPIEDLDKIEKLLDVAMNTINTPNLSAIKQACLDELAQINAAMEEQQGVALEAYNKEMAEYSAKQNAKRAAKEKERLAAEKKAKEEREAKEGVQPDSWREPRDSAAQPIERRV